MHENRTLIPHSRPETINDEKNKTLHWSTKNIMRNALNVER